MATLAGRLTLRSTDVRLRVSFLASAGGRAPVNSNDRRHHDGDAVKHATIETLVMLQPLLQELRGLGTLVERTPGAFYVKSRAFLHFHEDSSGIYADVKLDSAHFTRMRVTSAHEQANFVKRVRRCLCLDKATKGRSPTRAA